MLQKSFVTSFALLLSLSSANAEDFRLTSVSMSEGQQLTSAQMYKGFGCDGENVSPQLSWTGAPAGTKSFAITAYDPDAPTGSGWWHWNVINIPASVTSVDAGASGTGLMPKPSLEIVNDYGTKGFGGACPPAGLVHRYIFTVYALAVDRLDLPQNSSNALVGFMIGAHTIQSARLTPVYNR